MVLVGLLQVPDSEPLHRHAPNKVVTRTRALSTLTRPASRLTLMGSLAVLSETALMMTPLQSTILRLVTIPSAPPAFPSS